MKKIYLFTTAVLLCATGFGANAQGSFRPGYIVRLSGDTLRGQVGYHNARYNATRCEFMPAPGSPVERFGPAELRGYGVGREEAYRALPVPQRDSAGQARPSRLLFVEVMTNGSPANLYRYQGGEGTRYYLQKSPTAPLRELLVKQQEVEDGGRRYVQEIPVFRGVLTEEFSECPAIALSLARVAFRLPDLTQVVQRYNACRQPGSQTTVSRRSSIYLGSDLLLGGQDSQLLLFGNNYAAKGQYPGSLVPDIGLGLWLGSQALRDKLQLRIELHYVRQKYEDEFQYSVSGGGSSPSLNTYQARFSTSYLRLPLLLRYSPLLGRVRPFAEAGVSASRLLDLTQEIRMRAAGATAYGAWQPAYDPSDIRYTEYGFVAGAGVQLTGPGRHALSLLGRYEASNGFSEAAFSSNKFRRYSVALGIGLNRQR